MLPWIYGFHWTAGHIVFVTVFLTVLAVVAATFGLAWFRAARKTPEKLEHVRWHSDFADLPAPDRACRHQLSGMLRRRTCPNGFDCRVCELHAKLAPLAAPPVAAGMPLPLDRLYHRGHTWVKQEDDGTCTIGLDELGKRVAGTPDAVELPAPGTSITVNGTCCRMKRGGAEVRVLAPVDGEVVAAGGPGQGWYLKVRPNNADIRHLLGGGEATRWMVRELERLQLVMGPALADGGVLVNDIPAACPGIDWGTVCGRMFLEA